MLFKCNIASTTAADRELYGVVYEQVNSQILIWSGGMSKSDQFERPDVGKLLPVQHFPTFLYFVLKPSQTHPSMSKNTPQTHPNMSEKMRKSDPDMTKK